MYEVIRKQLFYMIPEKWDNIYLYASVIEIVKNNPVGEMFFYYFPKSIFRKNPINVYEVPSKFNIDEESYVKLAGELYSTIKALYFECKRQDPTRLWTNITIKIESTKFTIEYNYDPIISNEEENHRRRIIWIYENLNFPIESFNKEEKDWISEYLIRKPHLNTDKEVYSEGIYQNEKTTHNVVSYEYEEPKTGFEEENHQEERSRQIAKELNEIEKLENENEAPKKPRKRNQILN